MLCSDRRWNQGIRERWNVGTAFRGLNLWGRQGKACRCFVAKSKMSQFTRNGYPNILWKYMFFWSFCPLWEARPHCERPGLPVTLIQCEGPSLPVRGRTWSENCVASPPRKLGWPGWNQTVLPCIVIAKTTNSGEPQGSIVHVQPCKM